MALKKPTKLANAALQELVENPDNKYCCDCGTKAPRWASVNLGVLMCIECSGIHRNLGVHISKVRSLTLDKWQQKWIDTCAAIGNKIAKEYYEYKLPEDYQRPTQNDGPAALETWIRAKYEKKLYAPPGRPEPWELFEAGKDPADSLPDDRKPRKSDKEKGNKDHHEKKSKTTHKTKSKSKRHPGDSAQGEDPTSGSVDLLGFGEGGGSHMPHGGGGGGHPSAGTLQQHPPQQQQAHLGQQGEWGDPWAMPQAQQCHPTSHPQQNYQHHQQQQMPQYPGHANQLPTFAPNVPLEPMSLQPVQLQNRPHTPNQPDLSLDLGWPAPSPKPCGPAEAAAQGAQPTAAQLQELKVMQAKESIADLFKKPKQMGFGHSTWGAITPAGFDSQTGQLSFGECPFAAAKTATGYSPTHHPPSHRSPAGGMPAYPLYGGGGGGGGGGVKTSTWDFVGPVKHSKPTPISHDSLHTLDAFSLANQISHPSGMAGGGVRSAPQFDMQQPATAATQSFAGGGGQDLSRQDFDFF